MNRVYIERIKVKFDFFMLWCQWQNTKSLRNVALTFGQLFHEQTAMNNLQKVIVLVVTLYAKIHQLNIFLEK